MCDTVPLFEHLSEYEAIEDKEVHRAAFSNFVKRQKECLHEKDTSEDGRSTISRGLGEPAKDRRKTRKEETGIGTKTEVLDSRGWM